MAKQQSDLAELINRLPDPDERGLLSTIDKETVDDVTSRIHEGGRTTLRALVDLLAEPGQGDDVKPRYALHCLAVYVCKLGDRQGRRAFAKALASELGGDRPKAVQEYLIQQLQVAGGQESVPALGQMLLDEQLCEAAAQALTAIGDGAAEQFRGALPKVPGKSRLTVIQNLGVLRDVRSADAIKEALGDEDREVRLTAGWALANIGDASSADLLLKAADAQEAYERIKATKACLLLAERLLAAGKKEPAAKIYRHLHGTRSGPDEAYICELAKEGIAAAESK